MELPLHSLVSKSIHICTIRAPNNSNIKAGNYHLKLHWKSRDQGRSHIINTSNFARGTPYVPGLHDSCWCLGAQQASSATIMLTWLWLACSMSIYYTTYTPHDSRIQVSSAAPRHHNETQELSWCQLCRHWWYRRLPWWQPSMSLVLTHWGRDKKTTIFQTTFSKAFSWMKIINFTWDFTKFYSSGSN